MLATIQRWLGRGRSAVAVRAVPEDAPERPAPPEPEVATAVRRAGMVPGAVTEPELRARLRRELEERVVLLRARLQRSGIAADGQAVLDVLLQDEALVVRQLPVAAQEALAICGNPLLGLARLEPLFMRDPTLMQSLLREANSAWYGGEHVLSITPAIARIGTGGVRNVVLASAVQGTLCRPGSLFAPMAAQVWEHMVRCGPIARTMAPAVGVPEDQAFTLGLLHDVGKLIVFDAASSLRQKFRRDLQLPLAVVRDILKTLHEPVGGLAALRWNLGVASARAIADHHREPPPDAPDPRTEVIYLAERIDLAAAGGRPYDLDAWFATGALTASKDLAGLALADLVPSAEMQGAGRFA